MSSGSPSIFERLSKARLSAAVRPTGIGSSMLTARQREQILVGFNPEGARTRRTAADECIHERFQAQAERTPDTVALVYEDTRITYRELAARASQLARYLASLGVGPDTLRRNLHGAVVGHRRRSSCGSRSRRCLRSTRSRPSRRSPGHHPERHRSARRAHVERGARPAPRPRAHTWCASMPTGR